MIKDSVNIFIDRMNNEYETKFNLNARGLNKFIINCKSNNRSIDIFISKSIFKLAYHGLYPVIYDYSTTKIYKMDIVEVYQKDENFLTEIYKISIPVSQNTEYCGYKIFICDGMYLFNKFIIASKIIINNHKMGLKYESEMMAYDLKIVKCIHPSLIHSMTNITKSDIDELDMNENEYMIYSEDSMYYDFKIIKEADIDFINGYIAKIRNRIHLSREHNDANKYIVIPKYVSPLDAIKFIESRI